MSTKAPHLYELLVDFCTRHGAKSIKDLPGCWEREWKHGGNRWLVAVHAGPGKRTTKKGAEIEPGTFWIECNGLPAGMVDLRGWTIVAGTRINEKALRAALAGGR